jgi:hypothetical protein
VSGKGDLLPVHTSCLALDGKMCKGCKEDLEAMDRRRARAVSIESPTQQRRKQRKKQRKKQMAADAGVVVTAAAEREEEPAAAVDQNQSMADDVESTQCVEKAVAAADQEEPIPGKFGTTRYVAEAVVAVSKGQPTVGNVETTQRKEEHVQTIVEPNSQDLADASPSDVGSSTAVADPDCESPSKEDQLKFISMEEQMIDEDMKSLQRDIAHANEEIESSNAAAMAGLPQPARQAAERSTLVLRAWEAFIHATHSNYLAAHAQALRTSQLLAERHKAETRMREIDEELAALPEPLAQAL